MQPTNRRLPSAVVAAPPSKKKEAHKSNGRADIARVQL
jgi:hypothetical protein